MTPWPVRKFGGAVPPVINPAAIFFHPSFFRMTASLELCYTFRNSK